MTIIFKLTSLIEVKYEYKNLVIYKLMLLIHYVQIDLTLNELNVPSSNISVK